MFDNVQDYTFVELTTPASEKGSSFVPQTQFIPVLNKSIPYSYKIIKAS